MEQTPISAGTVASRVPAASAEIELLRIRQIKNFLALTLLSVGTPMLLMGDEVRRTQHGNNNAYCQDNETSWFDWNLCATNTDLVRFVQQMIRLRLHFDQGIEGGPIPLEEYLSRARIEWHGIELGKPDWSKDSHSLASLCIVSTVPKCVTLRSTPIGSHWIFSFLRSQTAQMAAGFALSTLLFRLPTTSLKRQKVCL